MARSRGNLGYKPNRYTVFSGATISSRPSGVTIIKDQLSTSGVTISGSNIRNQYGYIVVGNSAGMKMVSGSTLIGGVSMFWKASKLGFTTVTNAIFTSGGTKYALEQADITPATYIVAQVALDGSGVTAWGRKIISSLGGVTQTVGVSLQYVIFGT